MQLSIPQIPIQERGQIFTDQNFLYLNFFNSPQFGGLQLKHLDYNERHIFMNDMLKEIYMTHSLTIKEHAHIEAYSYQHFHYRLLFMIESFIYWLRKNIDEMIAFNYLAHYLAKHNAEPEKLEIFSIGTLTSKKKHELYLTFNAHIENLKRINKISNTFKHSFITSDVHNLIGRDEPRVNCLDLPWNDTKNSPVFHSYSLKEIIVDYVSFFIFSRETLKQFRFLEDLSKQLNPDDKHI